MFNASSSLPMLSYVISTAYKPALLRAPGARARECVTLCARGAWGVGKDKVGDCPGLCSEPSIPVGALTCGRK